MKDLRLAFAAAAIGILPFLFTAPFCGLYLDDYAFLNMLEAISPKELWTAFIYYVPGRNLHIPFFYGLLGMTGGSVPAMHMVSLAFDALNAALLFLLVRRLTGLRSVALAAAAAFAVAPNHGETHFWITLIPQCQIPAALTLTAFLLASGGGLLAACAVYAVALFTYDQVFFLWPLMLAVSWWRDGAPRWGRYASAAAALLALNVVHIALRYLSPYASGGRPLIRIVDFVHRSRDAVVAVGKGVLPWPTSSHAHWAWSLPLILLALGGAVWLLRAARAEARGEAGELTAWTKGRGWIVAAAGGVAWTVLAYFPNLFWYLSPRHNLLPSIGWSCALASAGAWAISRSRRTAAVLPLLSCAFFASAVVSNVHEGTQWVDSRLLRDSFSAAVLRLPRPVDSVFVVGTPRYLRRAPAFNLPHDVALAAGRALGQQSPIDGDYNFSPTRRGAIFCNDLSIAPAEAFRWLPASKANLLSFDLAKRSFSCVSAVRVRSPDGSQSDLPLRPNADCAMTLPMDADAYLVSSTAGAPRPGRSGPRAGGLSLLEASVSAMGAATRLDLVWRVETSPLSTIAFIPRLEDASGALLLDSVFLSRGAKRPYPKIWPLVDDIAPGLNLKKGQTLRQSFLLARDLGKPAPGAILQLDAYEISTDGRGASLGRTRSPVSPGP